MSDPAAFRDDALERALIDAALAAPALVPQLAATAGVRDLAGAGHREVWETAIELAAARRPFDRRLFAAALGKRQASGLVAALKLFDGPAAAPAVALEYARAVASNGRARRLAQRAADHARDDADRWVADLARATREEMGGLGGLAETPLVEAALAADAQMERAGSVGLTTGLLDLDRVTTGWKPTELVVLAGRPGMGKSAYAMHAALCAAGLGRHAAFFSLEMSARDITKRTLCTLGRIDLNAVMHRKGMTADERERWAEVSGKFTELPLHLFAPTAARVEQIVGACHALKAQPAGLALVVIDYLTLIHTPTGADDNRSERVGAVTRELKCLALDLDVPVVLLAQLNRECERRGNKRPVMSDLRDSGEVEQHADVVVFVYRDEKYDPATRDPGVAELIVEKNRNGPTGTARVRFNAPFTEFADL